MISAVLDTNVLVSSIIGITNPESTPGELLRLWRDSKFELLISTVVIRELQGIFEKPYFQNRLTTSLTAEMLNEIATKARHFEITEAVAGVASHPEDDLILGTAVSGDADVLVTGDRDLLALGTFQDAHILTPRAFLDLLDEDDRF